MRIWGVIDCASAEVARQVRQLPACVSLHEKLLRYGATQPQGFEYAMD